jgi:hypothetical protein
MVRVDSREYGRPSWSRYVANSCGGEYTLEPSTMTVVRVAARAA